MNRSSADTIVAASSPAGRSPRGLVRLSGSGCSEILGKLGVSTLPPRTLRAVSLDLPPRLPALVARFVAPASYTAQDMAEIQVVGHQAVLERLIARCVQCGARLAEPGEFTFRAFTAGKLDLTQAEGIAATIAAQSDSQLQAAGLLSRGHLGRFAHALVEQLADALALVEAGIDFTDQEDVVPIAPAALADRLTDALQRVKGLLSRSRSWGALEALPRVVLVGAPSTGKSTLFNALLGRRRAVVSELPGTTRDILAEPLTLRDPQGQSVELMLVDIAGLDTPRGALDHAVQEAARAAIESADLLLAVHDGGGAAPLEFAKGKPLLKVRTKADQPPPPGDEQIAVSVHQQRGLEPLRSAIAAAVGARGISIQADLLALQPRHQAALQTAAEHLQQAAALLQPQRQAHALQHVELIAAALRQALNDLENLGGRMTPDDILGRVFATFCVGK